MKKILLVIFVVVAVVIGIRMTSAEDTWLCDEASGQWIKHGNPTGDMPKEQCGQAKEFSSEQKNAIETHIKENISALSTIKEVLGGKFYVTNFSWQNNGTVKVNYEDGHIAVVAVAKPFFSEDSQVKFEYFNSALEN